MFLKSLNSEILLQKILEVIGPSKRGDWNYLDFLELYLPLALDTVGPGHLVLETCIYLPFISAHYK